MQAKPAIAVTMGDPAGIGPEVVVKALADERVRAVCRPIVFGDEAALREAARRLGLRADWLTIESDVRGVARRPYLDGLPASASTAVLDLGDCPPGLLFAGKPTRDGGCASLRYVEQAAAAVRDGHADALATAPIHKQAIVMAGSPFAGHTDLLGHLLGVEHPVMMLVGGPLRVALVTHHIALADVPDAISTEAIVATASVVDDSLRSLFAIPEPRLAVCGLNPHASDGSRFGTEELRLIEPAVVRLRRAGIHARGPVPPDTCFHRAVNGREFDAVICMYHDQGLIPLKLLAFDTGVNVTLGLPILRTSADHGTAYDIAGRGTASPNSMIEAILLAASMWRARVSAQARN
ncbi:MAG TPA: 4-hydroxythreonine-4-phosphate dehydrogenase PdxA [Planctomycetota bacterium]|nr:4-hydroxythreonine-4-phosphate dehydrogenase PdxA [Planctomycetota bacterium]HRR79346.1 4-hydroxythreonine-4-phosphate dehydrogenase PdxA [Planctomycetota bacterium]HRT96183.1 4-hydroxythreonine-4-phosphate dehydrogenase PdxA [Planctomycetota bacterium]